MTEKQELLDAVKNLQSQLTDWNEREPEYLEYMDIEVDFEDACMHGDLQKVEKYLDTVPYLTKYPDYMEGVIEYVTDLINNYEDINLGPEYFEEVGSKESLEALLEYFKSRPDC